MFNVPKSRNQSFYIKTLFVIALVEVCMLIHTKAVLSIDLKTAQDRTFSFPGSLRNEQTFFSNYSKVDILFIKEDSIQFLHFDTHLIPDQSHIEEALLILPISKTIPNLALQVVSTPSPHHGVNGDSSKNLSSAVQISSDGSSLEIPLNLDGIVSIDKKGWSTFGLKVISYDASRTQTSVGTNDNSSLITSIFNTTDRYPRLKVHYTVPEFVLENSLAVKGTINNRVKLIEDYQRTKLLLVNGDGSRTECSSSAGENVRGHWKQVNDPVNNPDEDVSTIYVEGAQNSLQGKTQLRSGSISWKTDLFTVAPLEGSGEIENITLYYRAKQTGKGGFAKACVKVGKNGLFPQQFSFPLTSSYITYHHKWDNNPYTGKSWSWSDLTSLQIGIMLGMDKEEGSGQPLCTQVYGTITLKNFIVGSDAGNNSYGLNLRFYLPFLSQNESFTYARLILPVCDFKVQDGNQLNLRITGHLPKVDSTPFTHLEIPDRFTRFVDWSISACELPEDMYDIHLTQAILASPNLSTLINESRVNRRLHSDSVSKYFSIRITGNSSKSSTNNFIYIPYFDGGILYNPIALELYKTVYDCFIVKEGVARVTDASALIHCASLLPLDFYVQYKITGNEAWHSTPILTNTAPGQAIEVTLRDLIPDTEYEYRIAYRKHGEKTFLFGDIYSFHTQRAVGEEFTFTIEADTHVRYSEELIADIGSIPQLQLQDLSWSSIESENADFHINLGDWFEGRGDHCVTKQTALYEYTKTRAYQGTRCWPTYFVLGNHEGENPSQDKYYTNARYARNRVMPTPDASVQEFYHTPGEHASYYAWEWGDALFIVLDPYSYCTDDPNADPWNWTLGKDQYEWLYHTLEGSSQQWKFIFIHHLVGGKSETKNYGRGGVEYVKYRVSANATYEWGGEDSRGNYVWATKRPGWNYGAIHDLLVAGGVNAVFHGHDHGFAHQVLDNIHYIECPTISGVSTFQHLYDYGFLEAADYSNGAFLNNNGYLRVTVNPFEVHIEYIGTIRDVDEADQDYINGEMRHAILLQKRLY